MFMPVGAPRKPVSAMSESVAKPGGPSAGTHRRIWTIAAPAIVAGSSAPLVGLVDAWAIGNAAGVNDLAAIGAGATLFNFLFWGFGFLRMGTTGLVAQAKGQNNSVAVARHIAQSAATGAAIGAAILLLSPVVWTIGVDALAVPAAVTSPLADYYNWRILSAPLVLITYGLTGYFIGIERTRDTMVLQLVLNLTNAALNMVFVLGLDMGAGGIGLGTFIAEAVTLGVGALLVSRQRMLGAAVRQARHRATWSRAALRRLMGVNGWLFVRTLVLMTVLASVTREAAEIGPAALAASHVLSTYLLLISLGLDAFAYAAEALSGAAYGRGDKARFRHWVMWTTLWAMVCAAGYSLAFAAFGANITAVITSLQDVRMAVGDAGLVLAIIPLVAVWCYQFDGIFIGATATRAMALTMAGAGILYALAVGPLAAAHGLSGLWVAVAVFMGARGALQAAYYPLLERRLA